jgi:IclR family transcriptional regulator, acetate operon repressor
MRGITNRTDRRSATGTIAMPRDVKPPKSAGDDERIRSGLLERTLNVIELLSVQGQGMQLFEIAQTLRIPRSAAHRVLTSLAERGYVRQDRHQGVYQLTAKIASLGFTFLASNGIIDLAQPVLDRLARESGELARLAMIDGRELIWVTKAQGSQFGLRYDPDMGQVARLSCSASGYAWLSCLPDDEALVLIDRQGIGLRKDYGPRAPETRAAVLKMLRQTRKRGFGLLVQAYSPWVSAVAVPIRHPTTAEVTGVVVISGPHVRLLESHMLALVPKLHEAARELSLASIGSPSFTARQHIFSLPASEPIKMRKETA